MRNVYVLLVFQVPCSTADNFAPSLHRSSPVPARRDVRSRSGFRRGLGRGRDHSLLARTPLGQIVADRVSNHGNQYDGCGSDQHRDGQPQTSHRVGRLSGYVRRRIVPVICRKLSQSGSRVSDRNAELRGEALERLFAQGARPGRDEAQVLRKLIVGK
jgi:hypothetical protein